MQIDRLTKYSKLTLFNHNLLDAINQDGELTTAGTSKSTTILHCISTARNIQFRYNKEE